MAVMSALVGCCPLEMGSPATRVVGRWASHDYLVSTDNGRRIALDRLPLPYSEALRLRDAGVADRVIAEILGVAPEALDTLIQVAQAKLGAAQNPDRE